MATNRQPLGVVDDNVGQTLRDFEAALSKCTARSAPQVERLQAIKDEALPVEMQFTTQTLYPTSLYRQRARLPRG